MNICILTPRFPFPENGGDVLRINSIARYLKGKGHHLYLLSFSETDFPDIEEANSLYDRIYTIKRKKWESAINALWFFIKGKPIQCGYYYSKRFKNRLSEVLSVNQPDLIICHLLRTVPYIELLGIEEKTIVEMTDALSKTYFFAKQSDRFSIKKIIYRLEQSRILKYEKHVVRSFPKIVLVSQGDVDYLESKIEERSPKLVVLSNGVEIYYGKSDDYDKNKICFVGNMRTLQNQDAVFLFVTKIFPKILEVIPSARFHIVGAQPSSKIKALACDNIIVTGFVDDIMDYISDSCIAVAPVHIAAGIQNKVLMSMGCGIPVIMSSLISNAIPELKDSDNCFIVDDNVLFADRCIELILNPDLRKRLSGRGKEMVTSHYSWSLKLDGYELMP